MNRDSLVEVVREVLDMWSLDTCSATYAQHKRLKDRLRAALSALSQPKPSSDVPVSASPAADELSIQVAAQCRVVAFLARTIGDVYADKGELFAAGALGSIAEMNGVRTAELMELLGNIANGMDIIEPEDAWVNPIFHEAQRRWPSAAGQSLTGQARDGSAFDPDADIKQIVERKGYCFECGHELHAPFCPACNPEMMALSQDRGEATKTRVAEALNAARKPTRYPDYLDDPEGLERLRVSACSNDGHAIAVCNNNSLRRLVETIERLQRAVDILAHPQPTDGNVWRPDREAIARIIDPSSFKYRAKPRDGFHITTSLHESCDEGIELAYRKADAILALPPAPSDPRPLDLGGAEVPDFIKRQTGELPPLTFPEWGEDDGREGRRDGAEEDPQPNPTVGATGAGE